MGLNVGPEWAFLGESLPAEPRFPKIPIPSGGVEDINATSALTPGPSSCMMSSLVSREHRRHLETGWGASLTEGPKILTYTVHTSGGECTYHQNDTNENCNTHQRCCQHLPN